MTQAEGRFVYVAAPWGEKPAGREIREELERRGAICTASWLERPDVDYDIGAEEAVQDESDLRDSSMLVLYIPEDDTSRGGRETELGMALALDFSPIHLIGKPRQIFHGHPAVTWFESIERWKEASW